MEDLTINLILMLMQLFFLIVFFAFLGRDIYKIKTQSKSKASKEKRDDK